MRVPFHTLLLTLASVLASCTERPGDGREGGSDKVEWSILQSLEAKHRGSSIRDAEYIESDGYHILCVPRDGDQTRLWIMMNPKSPPFYKQLPSGNYWLTDEQIETIRKSVNPISTVQQAFESHKKTK